MRELTQAEYKDLFKTTDREQLRHTVAFWNSTFPDHPVTIVERRVIDRPMIYREQLPVALELVLRAHEAKGRVYVGAGIGRMAA